MSLAPLLHFVSIVASKPSILSLPPRSYSSFEYLEALDALTHHPVISRFYKAILGIRTTKGCSHTSNVTRITYKSTEPFMRDRVKFNPKVYKVPLIRPAAFGPAHY